MGWSASGHQSLKLPVLVYSSVISLMTFSALLTLVRPEWEAVPALLVSAGALLFFISDTFWPGISSWLPCPTGKLRVRITYHLGQALIIVGACILLR